MIGRRGFIAGRHALGLAMVAVPVLGIIGFTIAMTGWALGLLVWTFSIGMTASIVIGIKLWDEG